MWQFYALCHNSLALVPCIKAGFASITHANMPALFWNIFGGQESTSCLNELGNPNAFHADANTGFCIVCQIKMGVQLSNGDGCVVAID